MLANYGYSDASGDYFITIDTDKCDGCGNCVSACPSRLFEILDEDPNDPMRDAPVVVLVAEKKRKIKCECNPCKPLGDRAPLPCVEACPAEAITHSW